ncbi:unnamed protein product [Dracunculus medinensis]|uniref:Phosphatidylinositol glycan, class U n=1 Tax=Dracunculus medinensis TaxID=318479 RepID=A0A0N4UEI2_DRAME|nr:unnamed protein product [Dracunculus medinensis]
MKYAETIFKYAENIMVVKFLCERVPLWFLSLLLRVFAKIFFEEFLNKQPEFVVPHNSFRRLIDGIHMRKHGLSPYDGDMLHCQPVLLDLFEPVIDHPNVVLGLFIILDTLTAEVLNFIAITHLRANGDSKSEEEKLRISSFIMKFYLLNPVAIGSCAISSLSVLNNFLVSVFIMSFVKGWILNCSILLSLLVHFSLYQFIYIVALFVRFPIAKKILLFLATFIISFFGMVIINYCSDGGFDYINSTFMFQLEVRDLSPNLGIFCYCKNRICRSNSFLLLYQFLILVSVFSSYPTVSDNLIYLCLLPVFISLHKYLRWELIIGGTMVSCLILAPIMWRMWVTTGSGNANFYFAIALCYSVAQILLLTDLLYAFVRQEANKNRNLTETDNVSLFVLK